MDQRSKGRTKGGGSASRGAHGQGGPRVSPNPTSSSSARERCNPRGERRDEWRRVAAKEEGRWPAKVRWWFST